VYGRNVKRLAICIAFFALLVTGVFTGQPDTAGAAPRCNQGLWFADPTYPEWCVSFGTRGNLWNEGYAVRTKYIRGNRFASPDGSVRCQYKPEVPSVGCYSDYIGYTKVLTDTNSLDSLDSQVGGPGRLPRLSPTRIWAKDGFECVVGFSFNLKIPAVVCNSAGGSFGLSRRKDWTTTDF